MIDLDIRTMEKSPEAVYEELLVLRCQARENAALNELVTQWQPRLLRHAFHLTDRRDAAFDVVQESWLAIVRGIHRLEDPASFPKWAYRIVTNKCADWTRRRQHERKVNANLAQSGEAMREAGGPTVTAISADEETTRLREAMRKLPGEQRAILSMCYLEGMPLREIAHVLGIPTGTVKSRLFAAREQLRRRLDR